MPGDRPSVRPYAWYVVGVLMTLYVIAFVDRFILSLQVAPLKADLGLSDTQISLLQGLAFALFYTFLGIPLGRLADSFNRRNLIIGGVFLWSLMTAFCGLARNFPQLFVARLGVGVGEAALSPAAYAIIADYFPPQRLSLAMSIYTFGGSLGIGLGLVAGGALVRLVESWGRVDLFGQTLQPWQLVFLAVSTLGVIGVALALTIAEPRRNGLPLRSAGASSDRPSYANTLRFIKAHPRTFVGLFVGFSYAVLMTGALIGWIPTFLIRNHGWTAPQAGYAIGVIVMIFGGFGLLTGGALCDRLIAGGREDAPILIGGVAALCITVGALLLAWASSAAMVLACFGFAFFFITLSLGIAPAAVQMIAPGNMRSLLSALYISAVNLIGQTLGPTAVAFCTDYLFHDELRVNHSIALTALLFAPTGWLLFWSRRHFRNTLAENAVPASSE